MGRALSQQDVSTRHISMANVPKTGRSSPGLVEKGKSPSGVGGFVHDGLPGIEVEAAARSQGKEV
jgi:hypothetical protein